jgi:hypothetical protein
MLTKLINERVIEIIQKLLTFILSSYPLTEVFEATKESTGNETIMIVAFICLLTIVCIMILIEKKRQIFQNLFCLQTVTALIILSGIFILLSTGKVTENSGMPVISAIISFYLGRKFSYDGNGNIHDEHSITDESRSGKFDSEKTKNKQIKEGKEYPGK